MRTRTTSLLAAVALIVPATLGVAASPTTQPGPLCNSKTKCESPDSRDGSKDPTPSAPSTPGAPTKPTDPAAPGPTDEPSEKPSDEPTDEPTESGGIPTKEPTDEPTEEPTDEPTEKPNGKFPSHAESDDDAPIFTKTPAAMGSDSLSFKGLSGISFVSVPTAGGGSIVTLKLEAEEIKISGFSLTVRPPDEDSGLVTEADTMTLKGDVTVYIGSITATTKDGDSLTLGPETPPPMDDVEPGLLRVTMGLVGSLADTITYSNTDQEMKKA